VDKLTVGGATITVTGLQVGDLTITSGSLAPSAASKVTRVFPMTGVNSCAPRILSIGNGSCTNGTFNGPGKLQIRSGTVFSMTTRSEERRVGKECGENSGTVDWIGGGCNSTSNGGASWVNLSGATFEVQGEGVWGE